MSRLDITTPNQAQTVVEGLYKDLERRIVASPPGLCPVDMARSFLNLCHAQTCGKCIPCRIGLGQLENLLNDVLNGNASLETIDLIEKTARVISNSADCAIGYEAANMVLKGVKGFKNDYIEHILNDRCICNLDQPVPCVALCPAGVDIPGYIALVSEERFGDAIKLIRKDNPFPTSCALICEHPCEARCRRNMIDDSVNIRGIKRYAADHAGKVPVPDKAPATGKNVAIIGGGPGGLSAAYFLSLMGHHVVVYEEHSKLGGMLRYGIPCYRLPRERLDEDIEAILSTGIEVKTGISIGNDISLVELKNKYDALYIAIGANTNKEFKIAGENCTGVISAVEMLGVIGDSELPDFKDKSIVVIGGGNVAMDVSRSAIRLGANKVSTVYRRRVVDMTALHDEIKGAMQEGVEISELLKPICIESDKNNNVSSLIVKPQMISSIDNDGRSNIVDADSEEKRIPCDIIILAVGQGIESEHFAEYGVPVKRGVIEALSSSGIENSPGIFAGGDCVTGPATAIRAIAAGKVAAANIDNYLGYNHIISTDVKIPNARLDDRPACGRVNLLEREAGDRINDFELIEHGMTFAEVIQETSRCLRCDHFGFGVFKGGRVKKW